MLLFLFQWNFPEWLHECHSGQYRQWQNYVSNVDFIHNHSYQLFLCWRWNIPALEVNTMPADALAPKVDSASAGMVLSV